MATCHCDGPPHTYDPSRCVNPRLSPTPQSLSVPSPLPPSPPPVANQNPIICRCDGPPHTYDPSWCVNPRTNVPPHMLPGAEKEFCHCDGPSHKYDPSWCRPSRPRSQNGNPRSRGVCDNGPSMQGNQMNQQTIDLIARTLGTAQNGWPEKLRNDCRDGGCANCKAFAREKAQAIYVALVNAGLIYP